MKIRCDVCDKHEASVFCSADEAALCDVCDHRVHHANKLAWSHPRFSLVHPSYSESPRCDICQERRAFLFCKEDRAILCRECDVSIHTVNEIMQKHNRFLLTGVKLSASSSSYSNTPSCSSAAIDAADVKSSNFSKKKSKSEKKLNDQPAGYTENISEYLMETLPGWCVDDFLDPSSSSCGYGGFSEVCSTSHNI